MLNGSPEERLAAYLFMSKVGPDALLNDLNAAVSAFEDAAKKQSHRAETWGYIGYSLALIALLLEAFLIFRPAHKTIVEAINELEENNEQLKQHEAEAFAALEDAEDAWIEAEHARRTSDALFEKTRADAAVLRKETNVFVSAAESLISGLEASGVSPKHQSELAHVRRYMLTSHELIREFTDSFMQVEKHSEMKEVTISTGDIMDSVLTAIRHHHTSEPIWLEAQQDFSPSVKICDQPARLLRATVGTVLTVMRISGAANATVNLDVEFKDDVPHLEFSINTSEGRAETGMKLEHLACEIEQKLQDIWASAFRSNQTIVRAICSENAGFDVKASRPVGLPATRSLKSRKPVRATKRMSNG